ncbi:MAG: hypothetical protein EOP59_19745, partial [Sphingomonadales bacterium]
MRRIALVAAVIATASVGIAALPAQTPSITDQRAQLTAASKAAKDAEARAQQLQRAAVNERDEARRARAREAAIAASIQAAEAEIVAARARIAGVTAPSTARTWT